MQEIHCSARFFSKRFQIPEMQVKRGPRSKPRVRWKYMDLKKKKKEEEEERKTSVLCQYFLYKSNLPF